MNQSVVRFSSLISRDAFQSGNISDASRIDLKQYFIAVKARFDSGEPFPYDVEELVPTVFSTKQKAVEALVRDFQQDIDFKVINRAVDGGRPAIDYHLSPKAFEFMVASKSKDVFNIYHTIFHAVTGTKSKRSEDPLILKHRQAKSILSSVMGMAKLLGTDEPMARVIAADHVRQHTGIDLSRLLTHNTVETKPLTPTELGKLIEKGARQVNQLLKEHGYAIQNEHGDWLPTDKGKPFATCNPYKSPNSSHTGYRTLWYPKIVDELQKTRKPESTN